MVSRQGENQNSHITGRSVHNQRMHGITMVSAQLAINHLCSCGYATKEREKGKILHRLIKSMVWTGQDRKTTMQRAVSVPEIQLLHPLSEQELATLPSPAVPFS
ncbi:UNVERIFIED_CONTAM: hypothetical protein FKN15_004356 [Acipenser sinensis]